MADNDPKYSRVARRHEEEKGRRGAKKPTNKSLAKKIILGVLAFILLMVVGGATLFFVYASQAPRLTATRLESSGSTIIYDASNHKITSLGTENRDYAHSNEIPQQLKNAVVSIEDKHFYKSHGVDPFRIAGAAWANLTGGSNGLQGGSTLEQQLIKLSYFSTKRSDQTLKRKAQEAWLALQLDRMYDKDQILTFYVNKVFMGNGCYGMQTASRYYYGKSLKNLDLAQTALIAGIPNAPTDYNPYSNKQLATQRRNEVLDAMANNGKITAAQAAQAKQESITYGLKKQRPASQVSKKAKIADPYLKQVIADAKAKGYDPYSGSLRIYTNLNMDYQKKLYNLANDDTSFIFPDNKFQIAATVVNPRNGAVIAMLGGRKTGNVTYGLNRAVQTERTNGSTAKPLMDYGPAIEYLDWATYHVLDDSKYVYPGTNIQLNDFDHSYKGKMTMRQALIESRNTPAIRALQSVGITRSQDFIQKLGFSYKKDLEFQNGIGMPSSTLQNAAAYAAFANGGTYYKPSYIRTIVTADGDVKNYSNSGTRAMKSSTAYMITDMLKQVITKGTGTGARIAGIYQAGKTGDNAYPDDVASQFPASADMDSWFNGYTKQYSMSIWTGYDHPYEPGNYLSPSASRLASQFYQQMMAYMMQDKESTDWTKPSDVYVKYVRGNRELYLAGSGPVLSIDNDDKKKESSSSSSSSSSDKSSSSSDDSSSSSSDSSSSSSSSAATTASSTQSSSSSAPASNSTPPTTPSNNGNNGHS